MARLTFQRMADVIHGIREEVQRRNPIGVNMYTPYLQAAEDALTEIHMGEKDNPTCDDAGGSGFRPNDPHDICQLIPLQNACNKCVSIEYRRRLDLMAKFAVAPSGGTGNCGSRGPRPGSGGRPRKAERCPCGEMTKHRAAARNHTCHDRPRPR